MKAKNILVIVLVNIFLICMVSIVDEYMSMQDRVIQLQTTVQNAVDSAVDTATASEELFSSQFEDALVASQGISDIGTDRLLQSTLRTYNSNTGMWIDGNSYIMSMYYQQNGHFPYTQGIYDAYAHGKNTQTIYEWLYGGLGTDFYSDELGWANRNYAFTVGMSGGSRSVTNAEFNDFYNHVGKKMTQSFFVKKKNEDFNAITNADGTTIKIATYEIVQQDNIPTLSAMGLLFDGNNYVKKNSTMTNDNFVSSYHLGKGVVESASFNPHNFNGSIYFYTPYSLGVTYVPVEVLQPAVCSHLEQLVRFHKSLNGGEANFGLSSDYASADGCISDYNDITGRSGGIGWYVDNTGTVTNAQIEHQGDGLFNTTYTPSHGSIINDGLIEYDMSTVACKVDYFYLDNYYNNDCWKIVNFLEGSTPAKTSLFGNTGSSLIRQDMGINNPIGERQTLPQRLKNTDTSTRNSSDKDQRIIAKVTVKLNVHIPYKSGILTWFVQTFSTINHTGNHYDVKTWNPATNTVNNDVDGIWFTYTTFVSTSR